MEHARIPQWDGPNRCPKCGTILGDSAGPCPHCQAGRDGFPHPPTADSPNRPPEQSGLGLGIQAAFLGLACIAAGFFLVLVDFFPLGLFIPLAIILAPIMVWLARKEYHGGLTGPLAVVLIVLISLVAGFAAFFVACFGGFFVAAWASESMGAPNLDPLQYGLITAFILGPIVGIVIGSIVFVRLWRRRR